MPYKYIAKNLIFPSVLLGCLIGFSTPSAAQEKTKKELDLAAIKTMEGCYKVTFKYTETFAPEVDYEKAYDYTSAAFEWAQLVEETEDKVVLQHLLIISDSMIIKHWRQDWTYEKKAVYRYDKNNRWAFEPKEKDAAQGTWTQEVFQVDDGPRYTGTATWTHVDGVSTWYNKADSPLPRRESSRNKEYNVMKRGNRIKSSDYGWMHEQDNDKIIREDGKEDVLLVQEKGYNTYVKQADADCKAAQEWWSANQEKWALVRSVWEDIYGTEKPLELKLEVDGKKIYEHLFMGNKYTTKKEIKALLNSYVESRS
jgi:hypothetical protein